ncbi:putative LysR family transcriptional regulator [Streptomyces sp. NBRC 110611]|uniref:LysR substrate-binding domain-containing protein n=1 Tax=Streptomyces sp. NBRC 110611 TaxID=1621259 RepID=UPI0008588C02|nr:LysR substrate-binding domain-containing protein [Streptomyces sp. NBRC 110611]GAU65918.1 putative LysR family transcriptional regulator [Streptomyces sp. NBRC 110611]
MIHMARDINLTNRLLEQFLVVAEEQHFGRAAERLSMGQPPLSQSIQRLERGLGVRLFERGPGGVSLTGAGEVFAGDAQRLLEAQSTAIERVRRVAAGLEGDVRVGYVSILSHHYLPGLLRAASEELPGLRVHLHQDSAAALADMVRSGALDLGFLRDPSPLSAELVSQEFAVERIAAALPHDHPLAAAEEIGLADLRGEDFVLPAAAALPALAQQVQLACHDAGFTPLGRAVSDDLTGLLSYVASGLCVTLLPERLRDFPIPGVAFVPLRGESPYLKTTVAAVRRPDADAAVLRLLELITRRTAA